MKLKVLVLSFAMLLGGCSCIQSDAPKTEETSELSSFLNMFNSKPEKRQPCSGSIVKGCQPVVYFDVSSKELSAEAKENMDWAIQKMTRYERYQVVLTGHADPTGESKNNQLLSKKRVLEVKEYLIDNGIDDTKIQTEYKGDTEPVCQEDFCNELSRRVEFKIYPSKKNWLY